MLDMTICHKDEDRKNGMREKLLFYELFFIVTFDKTSYEAENPFS